MTTETEQITEPQQHRYFIDVCNDVLSVMFNKSHDIESKRAKFYNYLTELKEQYKTEISTLWLKTMLSNEMTERQKQNKINHFITSHNIKTQPQPYVYSIMKDGVNSKQEIGISFKQRFNDKIVG
jgi:hypothetical protein